MSRILGNRFVRLCVQQRLAYSAGDSPARVIIRNPETWMAGRRETEYLKPIDKAILWNVSESSGRNESERIGGLEKTNIGGRVFNCRAKTAWLDEN